MGLYTLLAAACMGFLELGILQDPDDVSYWAAGAFFALVTWWLYTAFLKEQKRITEQSLSSMVADRNFRRAFGNQATEITQLKVEG